MPKPPQDSDTQPSVSREHQPAKSHGTAQIILDREDKRDVQDAADRESERRLYMFALKLLGALLGLSILGNVALTVLLLKGTFSLSASGVVIGGP